MKRMEPKGKKRPGQILPRQHRLWREGGTTLCHDLWIVWELKKAKEYVMEITLKIFRIFSPYLASFFQNITYIVQYKEWASLLAQMERICLHCRRLRLDPWVGKIPWRREWLPTPVFLLGEFHGQRNLEGYHPWGHKDWDTTEWLKH